MITILDQIEAQNRATLRTIIDGLSGAESVQRMLDGRSGISELQAGSTRRRRFSASCSRNTMCSPASCTNLPFSIFATPSRALDVPRSTHEWQRP